MEGLKRYTDGELKKSMPVLPIPFLVSQLLLELRNSCLREVVVTNTIEVSQEKLSQQGANKIKVLSVAPIFAEAIKRIHGELSVSELFI